MAKATNLDSSSKELNLQDRVGVGPMQHWWIDTDTLVVSVGIVYV